MEAVVSGCVGVLAAGCVAGLCASIDVPRGRLSPIDLAREATALWGGLAARAREARRDVETRLERLGVSTRYARKERELVEREMPEAFAALAISLGSGLSLEQAMRYVGSRSREPVRTEFMRVSVLMACGVSASTALDEMLGRIQAPGLGLVALALKVSQRTGAPLADLLLEAAALVGQRIELARQLDVKTAQVRMSARLVAAMPAVMIAFLVMTSADFRRGMAAPMGAGALLLALAMNLVAWKIMRSVMRVGL